MRCTGNAVCSGNPVKVVITDECAGCGSDAQYHFDLSGSAFGSMAISGEDEELRNAGKIVIEHRRWFLCYLIKYGRLITLVRE